MSVVCVSKPIGYARITENMRFAPIFTQPTSRCDRGAACLPRPTAAIDGAQVLCNPSGGFEGWWVLPMKDIAVKI